MIAKAIDSSLVHSHEDTYAWPKHNKVHAHSVPDPVNEENTKVKDTNVYIYVCVRMYISIQRERERERERCMYIVYMGTYTDRYLTCKCYMVSRQFYHIGRLVGAVVCKIWVIARRVRLRGSGV